MKLDPIQSKNDHINDKSEGNFHLLTNTYSRLYKFDRSVLGRFFWLVEKVYMLLMFQPKSRSYYRLLVDDAKMHSVKYGINYNDGNISRSRLKLVGMVLSYTLRHPYSSLRLLSRARIKRLCSVVLHGDISHASGWVEQRFPELTKGAVEPVLFAVDAALDKASFAFSHVDKPDVSIVVPVYNQYRMTVSCLLSILEHTTDISYEVVLADDCSTDLTFTIGERIENLVIAKTQGNQGFLLNCNQAVSVCRGKTIVLLNNDTNVQPGWLSALLETLYSAPDVGLVGPKLLFKDGVLQEAGGIIWRDGSGWNYGRGQDPCAPEFNYVRDADYISGACVAIKKSLWDRLGGFDSRFCPAYYEDTDLAFQVRGQGLRVIYQPKAVVVHYEGVSNGTDTSSGLKKHQVVNRQVFIDKWQPELLKNHEENGTHIFQARERSKHKKTVVFIDHYVPFFDKDAGSRSTFLYVKSMVNLGVNVKFLGANFFPHEPYTAALQQLGVEVLHGERYARNWKLWFSDNAAYIDVVYLHRPHITEDFIDFLITLEPKPKLVYFGHDLHYVRTEREAELLDSSALREQAADWKRREFAIFDKVDTVFYPSAQEVSLISEVKLSCRVRQLPLYVLDKISRTYSHSQRSDYLFVGGFSHTPNKDAVLWFVLHVMPLLTLNDDAVFHIVGSNVPDEILELACANIVVHGFLSDDQLAELYSRIRAVVVPLRFGAGVKGKILEALQHGVPIVTTEIGAEGLPEAETVLSISTSAQTFADNLSALYNEQDLAEAFVNKFPNYIDCYFSHECINNLIAEEFLS